MISKLSKQYYLTSRNNHVTIELYYTANRGSLCLFVIYVRYFIFKRWITIYSNTRVAQHSTWIDCSETYTILPQPIEHLRSLKPIPLQRFSENSVHNNPWRWWCWCWWRAPDRWPLSFSGYYFNTVGLIFTKPLHP